MEKLKKLLKYCNDKQIELKDSDGGIDFGYARACEDVAKKLTEVVNNNKKQSTKKILKDWQMWEDCILSFLRSETGVRVKFDKHVDDWNTHTKLPKSAYERE